MALRAANLTLSGKTFLEYDCHCVYAWKRGADFLYVGYTRKGLGRVFQHNIINAVEPVLPEDVIEIWNGFQTASDAKLFEQQLIADAHPEYNQDWKTRLGKRTICIGCGNTFTPRREWQKFCSNSCRPKPKPIRERTLLEKVCENCGTKFKTYSVVARFCEPPCRWQFWGKEHPRVRLSDEEIAKLNNLGTNQLPQKQKERNICPT